MKWSETRLIAACMAVAIAGWVLPSSAIEYIAHWDFSSDALGEAEELNNYPLVNHGVTIADGAAVFDGSSSPVKHFVSKHPIGTDGRRIYTIECFVQADADCNGMIMELSPNINDSGSKGSFYLYANEGAMVRTSTGGYNGEAFTNGNICDGQWHHVAVIIDQSTNVVTDAVRLYLDGVRQGRHTQSSEGVCLYVHNIYIGSRGGTSLPFKGKIDDVRITIGALDPSEFLPARSEGMIDVRAYWKFDGGNALADSSGNGNVLQGSQGVTFANGYASFNGTASDVRTASTLDLSDTKDLTVEFFVRRHVGADSIGMILEHSSNYWINNQGFYTALNDYDLVGNVTCEFKFKDGGGHRAGVAPQYSVNSGWHHVAIVKDSSRAGSGGCTSLYVDGIRQANYPTSAMASGELMRNDYLYFGSRANRDFFLDADIDDVRITAAVLLPGQFLQKRTGPMEDVIAYWPFDKATNMLEDASGNGNVLTGTGVTVNDGAVVFDGSQAGFATLAPLPLYPYDSMTVEWFMKTDVNALSMLLETTADYNNRPGAFTAIVQTDGRMEGAYKTLHSFNVAVARNVTDGKWHHYALVYDWDDATAGVVKLYKDKTLMTERNPQYTNASIANLRSEILYIGTRGGSSLPFVGELDDIKITGRVLDPSEFMTKRSSPPGVAITIR